MADPSLTLDQLLSIEGLGGGPYGGGDVVRWSPDGAQLLFAARLGGELALWLMPRAGGFPRRVTTAPIALPFLASPMQSFSTSSGTRPASCISSSKLSPSTSARARSVFSVGGLGSRQFSTRDR